MTEQHLSYANQWYAALDAAGRIHKSNRPDGDDWLFGHDAGWPGVARCLTVPPPTCMGPRGGLPAACDAPAVVIEMRTSGYTGSEGFPYAVCAEHNKFVPNAFVLTGDGWAMLTSDGRAYGMHEVPDKPDLDAVVARAMAVYRARTATDVTPTDDASERTT